METDGDFATMKESDLGESQQDLFEEGQILEENAEIENDAACQLALVHQDHVICVSLVPHAPFNTFLSGDQDDKCFLWKIKPRGASDEEEEKGEHFPGQKKKELGKYVCEKIGELEGHTETLEFIKFNHDGKYCLTGGMNNKLRVW